MLIILEFNLWCYKMLDLYVKKVLIYVCNWEWLLRFVLIGSIQMKICNDVRNAAKVQQHKHVLFLWSFVHVLCEFLFSQALNIVY